MQFIVQNARYEHKSKRHNYVVTYKNISIFDWIIYAEISLFKEWVVT